MCPTSGVTDVSDSGLGEQRPSVRELGITGGGDTERSEGEG